MRLLWAGAVAAGLFGTGAGQVALGADEVILRHGGRLVGELAELDPGEEGWILRLPDGGTIGLRPEHVERVVKDSPARQAYRRHVARMPDSADGHWRMAQWCQKVGLEDEGQRHLAYVLERDEDHAEARKALGYVQRDGQWVHPEAEQRSQGLVRHQGRLVLPQTAALREARADRREALGEWHRQLRIWRRWLDAGRVAQAQAALAEVDDPLAAEVLVKLLADEADPNVRELYLQVLGRFDLPLVTTALAELTLSDADERVRQTALAMLKRRNNPNVPPQVAQLLSSPENAMVNRAAYVLHELGDPSVVPQLIDSLTTVHRFRLPETGNLQAGFTPGAGGPTLSGFGAGNRPKYVDRELQNPAVLRALTELTGVDLGYAKGAWWNWYTQTRVPASVNLRRSR